MEQVGRGFDLEPVIACITLKELEDGQPVLFLASFLLEDIVVEPGGMGGSAQLKAVALRADISLATPALLRNERGISDLEGLGRDVRTVGEQLLGGGRAFGTRAVDADLDARGDFVGSADRCRKCVEFALDADGVGTHFGMFIAGGRLEAELAEGKFL